jgi:hypothetical protein
MRQSIFLFLARKQIVGSFIGVFWVGGQRRLHPGSRLHCYAGIGYRRSPFLGRFAIFFFSSDLLD